MDVSKRFNRFEAWICDLYVAGAVSASDLQSSTTLNPATFNYIHMFLEGRFKMYHDYVWSRQWPHEIALEKEEAV